jgi:fructoselysine-6-P-deglycase FrlB-like protein
MTSGFRVDVGAQAQALRCFGRAPISLGLYSLLHGDHDLIVFTGTGASHLAAVPGWQRLINRGRTAAWIDARQLIANPSLITADSLLVVSSRSGASPDVVALLAMLDDDARPSGIVAVTDDLASPLAAAADGEILLRSQLSQSPKGFLNVLAAHDYIASMILGEDNDDVASTARVVAATRYPADLMELASEIGADRDSRLAFIGFGEHAATSLYAALLTRETTKIGAEGFAGHEFRRDSVTADSRLTAVLFAGRDPGNNTHAGALAAHLISAGARVLTVGRVVADKTLSIRSPASHISAQVAHGVMVAEHLVSSLAA